MAKMCPITKEKVLYIDCLECEEKKCRSFTEDESEAISVMKNTGGIKEEK